MMSTPAHIFFGQESLNVIMCYFGTLERSYRVQSGPIGSYRIRIPHGTVTLFSMARRRSGNAVHAQMERLGEIDSELENLSIFDADASPEALFDRLEEHARLRLEMALEHAPERRRLRPIPADLDPAYLDRLENYFEALYSHAHDQRAPGAGIVVKCAANDGKLAAGQLQYAIEGRRLLAEGKTESVALLMYACTREFNRYAERLTLAATSVRASSRVRPRKEGWDAVGEKHARRLRELRAPGRTDAEVGRMIAREERPKATRSEIETRGNSIIRSLRRRFKRRGEPFQSPTRQAAKSPK